MSYFLLSCLLASGIVGVQGLFTRDRCFGRCFAARDFSKSCQCDIDCEILNICCYDFWTACRGSEIGQKVPDQDLSTFAQSLWDSDANRIDPSVYNLNYQGQTTADAKDDQATSDLIVSSTLDAMLTNKPTYKTFIELLDNYEENVNSHEQKSQAEVDEEKAFMTAISGTTVFQKTFEFLRDKGFIKNDMRSLLLVFEELWFSLHPRRPNQHTNADRSGFEHVILGEKNNNTHGSANATTRIVGFRNWVRYYDLQRKMKIDYKGYIDHIENPNMAEIRFNWDDAIATNSTFLFGTSPEFDLSLFTVCALTRPNGSCDLTINGKALSVRTRDRRVHQILQINAGYITFSRTSPTVSLTTAAP